VPYWLESDTFGDEPVWDVLAGGNPDLVDHLQAVYCRLKAKASHTKKNGYLTEQGAVRAARRRRYIDLLCTPVLDEPPLMHRPGDECSCLGDDQWIDGFAYRMHAFLKKNPSRAEYERNRAQKADLRDARLKASAYSRDGGCCRYCRSGPLSPKAGRSRDRRKVLTYDHVDPDQPAGPDGSGLVTCCGRCNEYKGRRTPYEADMVLLPVPTEAERSAWERRGLALLDRPDHQRTTDEPATDQQHATDSDSDPTTDPITDTTPDPIDDPAPPVSAPNGDHQLEQARARSRKPPPLGRVGQPPDPAGSNRPTAQPTRPASAPDIYHRRSRAAPAPEYIWPPGSVPATPSTPEDDHAQP